ncbi:hypothetical protein LBMAG53_10130 [Planctomycetota bacterium]|nr:hypothetical protein LBMAG53_10130 [Planctomycetota bacterium]
MTMLVTIAFAKPLSRDGRVLTQLALAGLAKAKAVWIAPNGWNATVAGEALGTKSVRAALEAEGVVCSRVDTTLTPDEDARCEDTGEAAERFRPAGR